MCVCVCVFVWHWKIPAYWWAIRKCMIGMQMVVVHSTRSSETLRSELLLTLIIVQSYLLLFWLILAVRGSWGPLVDTSGTQNEEQSGSFHRWQAARCSWTVCRRIAHTLTHTRTKSERKMSCVRQITHFGSTPRADPDTLKMVLCPPQWLIRAGKRDTNWGEEPWWTQVSDWKLVTRWFSEFVSDCPVTSEQIQHRSGHYTRREACFIYFCGQNRYTLSHREKQCNRCVVYSVRWS